MSRHGTSRGIGNERRERTFYDNRRVGTDEKCDSASTTSGACGTLSVNCNVTTDNDSVAAIPGSGFYPVNCVEERSGGTIACVLRVDTFYVEVTRCREEVHKGCLHGLGLVNDSLSSDINATDGLGVDVVTLKKARYG
jgi:hypothetical protein